MYEYTIQDNVQAKFLKELANEFESAAAILHSQLAQNASELHLETIQKLQPQLSQLRSHKSCFCCLVRMPEKVLDCGHSLCNNCIKIFGRQSPSERYTFVLCSCPLCPSGSAVSTFQTFQFVPPNAGIRVLSLDGGGVRGVIPLIFLGHMEQQLLALGCPLTDHFDFVCGTSAGMDPPQDRFESLLISF
jgi:hypothetical protein